MGDIPLISLSPIHYTHTLSHFPVAHPVLAGLVLRVIARLGVDLS